MNTSTSRPKYLNLLKIRLPIPGIVSIAHRISGVLLFLAIPWLVYLLHLSTISESGYQQSIDILSTGWIKIVLFVLAWSVFHHLFAGIRYLLIDMDIGVEKISARRSAIIVSLAGVLSALLLLVSWL